MTLHLEHPLLKVFEKFIPGLKAIDLGAIDNNNYYYYLHIFQQVCFFRKYFFVLLMKGLHKNKSKQIKSIDKIKELKENVEIVVL